MAYAFTTQGATPKAPQGSNPNPTGGTAAARALNTAQGIQAPPIPLVPPINAENGALKSHSITHPDGTVVTQTFHNPEQGLLSKGGKTGSKPDAKPTAPSMPPIRVVDGTHHIPFRSEDGSIKFINAKGELS